IDKGFYAPLRQRGARPVVLLIASIGVTLMVQGLIRLFFGAGSYSFFETETKDVFRIDTSFLGSTRPLVITEPQLLMIVVTLVSVLALHFFLTRSRLGKAMRAMADNADLAQVSGINTALVVRVTWIVAGALACMAGTMLAL
ncbi:MAG: branched-chain amino acid ABC transporter permease, partial [Devosia sp.]